MRELLHFKEELALSVSFFNITAIESTLIKDPDQEDRFSIEKNRYDMIEVTIKDANIRFDYELNNKKEHWEVHFPKIKIEFKLSQDAATGYNLTMKLISIGLEY